MRFVFNTGIGEILEEDNYLSFQFILNIVCLKISKSINKQRYNNLKFGCNNIRIFFCKEKEGSNNSFFFSFITFKGGKFKNLVKSCFNRELVWDSHHDSAKGCCCVIFCCKFYGLREN